MIKLELIISDRNWVLESFANELVKHAPENKFEIKINEKPSGDADIYYFMPYSIFKKVKGAINVGFFTHIEDDFPEAIKKFFKVARQCDLCICMSKKYEKRLKNEGINNVVTIFPGVSKKKFFPKLKIGVVGRAYHTGRKNEALVSKLLGSEKFEFHFTGEGWPSRTVYYADDELNDFYNKIDYLLIPAKIEGGPMPLMEALAAGTQVIAPDVGFVEEFPHISYKNSDFNSLNEVLNELYDNKIRETEILDPFSWEKYAREHFRHFNDHFQKHSNITSASEATLQSKRSICIVIHGSERNSKGGPSRRCIYTQELLNSDYNVDVSFNLANAEAQYDLIHVLNCWPIQSAYNTLLEARKRTDNIVFSPILMDLSTVNYYRDYLLLKNDQDVSEYFEKVNGVVTNLLDIAGIDLKYVKECCDLSEQVIALSLKEKSLLISLGVNPEKIKIVKNSVDPNYVDDFTNKNKLECENTFKSKYQLDKFVLTVGRVESRKNLISLCNALSNVDIKIVSIGSTSEPEYRKKIENLYHDKVIFIDHIEDKAILYNAYSSAVCYVQTSWCEGASLATLEAHAIGLPIVVLNRSGESEYYSNSPDVKLVHSLPEVTSAVQGSLLNKTDRIILRNTRQEEARCLIEQYKTGTAETYEAAFTLKKEKECYIDVTSLAHSIITNRNTTGALALERELCESVSQVEKVQYIFWVDANVGWKYVPRNELTLQNLEKIFISNRDGIVNKASQSVNYKKSRIAEVRSVYHYVLRSRKVPIIIKTMMKHTVLKLKIEKQKRAGTPIKVNKRVVTTPNFFITKSRLYTVGNAWISNAAYLNDLINLIEHNSLKYTALIYDILPITHKSYFPKESSMKFEKHLIQLLSYSDRCVGISNHTVSQLHSFCKSRLIANVSLSKMTLSPTINERTKKINSPKRFILYVSSINDRKNHSFLIDVWNDVVERNNKLADVKLILVGKGSFDKVNLNCKNVIHMNSLNDSEVAYLYNECLFTVYPSIAEGYGLPVVESLLHGKPCITTDLSSLDEVNHPALIKLKASEYFDWYNAILSLLSNDAVLKSLNEEAEHYSNAVDLVSSAKQFLGVLRKGGAYV